MSLIVNPSTWDFDNHMETSRVIELEEAGSADDLVLALKNALQDAFGRNNEVRFGRERSDHNPEHVRAVVQFSVGAKVFKWFFNARTGYRAHFHVHYKYGLRFNNQILEALLAVLDANLSEEIPGRELGYGFADCGAATISKRFLMRSLVRYVSKIWYCTKRINVGGGIQDLPTGTVGEPRLLLQDGKSWPTFYREDKDAWLDVKGGFLGDHPYQEKLPFKRAKTLACYGTA